jgi:Zn-dependent protease with chaperone function
VLVLAVLGWVMPAARSVVIRQRVCEAGVVAALVWLVVASVPLPRVGWKGDRQRREVTVAAAERPAAGAAKGVEIPRELIARPRVGEEVERGGGEAIEGGDVMSKTEAVAPRRVRVDWGLWLARLFMGGAVMCAGWLVVGRVVLWWMIRRSRGAPVKVLRVLEGMMVGDRFGWAEESGAARVSLRSTRSAPAWFERTRVPRVWVTPRLARPVTLGVWRPVILLPESLLGAESGGQLRQVLLHELGHIRQGDGWGNLLFCVGLPVLYWNPLYWWVRRCSTLLRELVADDWASRADGKEAYVTGLVALARTRVAGWTGAAGVIGVVRNQSDFYRRMRMLLERQNPLAMGCSGRFRAALAVGALAVVVGMGATVGVTPARGQTAGEAPAGGSGGVEKGAASPAAERVIRGNDLLNFSVRELTGPGVETVRQVRVSDKGTVTLPLVGTLKVEGLTPTGAEQVIRQKYRDANLIQDSKVSIEIVAGKEASGPPASGAAAEMIAPAPGVAAGIAKMTDAQIGMVDAQMRKMLDERSTLEARVKELGEKGYGAQHPEMVQVTAKLADTDAKISKRAREWRDVELKRAGAGEAGVRDRGAAGAGGDAFAPARGERAAVGGVQLDVVSLANSTVEAAGAVRVAKAELASKRKMKETGALIDIEREEANLETAVKRLELLKGIAAIALEGARQESDRAKQLYQRGVQGQREVSEAEARVKMLELILKSAG